MRKINQIIIHCSATPEGRDIAVDTIRQWHKQRGFRDIGYHYIIYRDGSIHVGRPESQQGAHCTGHNANSIGICYVGGMERDMSEPKDTRTPAQRKALAELCHELIRKYPEASIHGHNEFANKACPSFNVRQWKEEVDL